MPSDPTDVRSTIKVHQNGGAVEVAVISGFAQITTFGLKYIDKNGTGRSIVSLHDGKIGHLYPFGDPCQIIKNGGLVCWGRTFKTSGDSYNVICSFKQVGGHLQDSDAVSGGLEKKVSPNVWFVLTIGQDFGGGTGGEEAVYALGALRFGTADQPRFQAP